MNSPIMDSTLTIQPWMLRDRGLNLKSEVNYAGLAVFFSSKLWFNDPQTLVAVRNKYYLLLKST